MHLAAGKRAITSASAESSTVEEIFRTQYSWLQAWLKRRTPVGHLPEDVAAETILRLTQMAQRGSIQEPRAVMTVIARRIIYDLRARADLHRAYEACATYLPDALEPSPEERLLVIEALRRIDRALRPLSIKARSAFLLSQIEGLGYAEIAQRLGVSVSMIRKYIAAALKACYQDMAHDA